MIMLVYAHRAVNYRISMASAAISFVALSNCNALWSSHMMLYSYSALHIMHSILLSMSPKSG